MLKKDLPLIIGHLPEDFQKKIRDFLSLCEDLQSLTDRENDILLETGTVAFDGFYARKLQLMRDFEIGIPYVFEMVKTQAPHNMCLKTGLIEIIQEIRRSLCINTTFLLNDLKKRQSRMNHLKDSLASFTDMPDKETVVCH